MQKKWKAGNHKKGFTTVELVVVTIIILILSGGIILSLVSWYRNAQFRKQNEYAQTIFSAVQNRLTEYSYSGTLEELEDLLEENGAKNIDQELKDKKILGNDGKPYDLDQVWYESQGKSELEQAKYQGTIYSLIGTPKDYQAYQTGDFEGMTKEEEALTTALYEMLETYLYDTSILSDGVVCVEFSASDGQVFAALYSEKQDDFTYGTPKEDKTINICDRTRSRRKKVMLGYYGVDTMAKATTPKAEKPVLTDVQLNNEETLNLSFKLSKVKSAWNQLNYQVDVYNEASNHIGLSIILNAKDTTDGGKYKWPDSYNSKKQVLGTVKRYWYDKKGNQTSTELGKYKFYLYVESNGVVHLVLDAADLSATSQNYIEAYDGRGIGTSSYTRSKYPNMDSADEILNESYSFHRFGLSAERIYCKIKASGTGYKPTALKKSNESDVYYGDKSTSAGEKGKTTYSYEIANARHLYNMRYIEDIEKEKNLFQGNEGSLDEYAYTIPQKMTWSLTQDIDWKKLIQDKFYFDSGEVEEKDTQFLSILQLRKNSVFETEKYSLKDWKLKQDNHRIKGLEITYEANENAEIEADDLEATGLFLENEGKIRGVTLDGIKVTGTNRVGAFCGVNSGALENLMVDDAYADSSVSGKPYQEKEDTEDKKSGKKKDDEDSDEWGECIGGIFGVHESENASRDFTFQKLLNRADVTGAKFVGGITGWMTGKGNQKISIEDCQNYGAVYADEDSENPMFIGGIIGYAQNQKQQQDKELFSIEGCISSPQYDSREALEIIQGVKDGTRQLKGTYVGGIAGYNQGCTITDCSTENESSSRQGYVFGDKYVGGIVGISSGLTGRIDGNGCVNEANVIGNTYVGGIVGCNAAPVVQGGHYVADNEEGTLFKDVADTIYAVRPEKNRDLEVIISSWTNQGVVAATENYAGGITGYNTGRIYGCSSDVGAYSDQEILNAVEDLGRDYAGGIAGYNNGIIGNTPRDEKGSSLGESGETLSTVSHISGRHYVGGIVGYNDVDALVEDYELTGGYIKASGNFVGGYAGLNASSCLLQYTKDTQTGNHNEGEARNLVSKPNEVTGKYFVGGIIGGNLVCANTKINTVFEVDNFLGSIHAKAYAGGFIGLNTVLRSGGDHKARIKAYQEALLAEAEQTESVTDNFAEAVSDSIGAANSSDLQMSIIGRESGMTASRLGSLAAEDVFAGGVIGYSKDSNYLLIKDVENLTPVTTGGTISENVVKEQAGRADASSFAYAYAGGVIGKVGRNTTLDNCRNRDVGDVSVSENATYTGGLCEINQGTIKNCQASSVGNNVKDKVGGICGVNLGNIMDCRIEGSTVTGRNDVGGITAENFGWIENIGLKSANISASGNNAGAIAGYNGEFGDYRGSILVYVRGALEPIDIVKVSGNTNIGGLVGNNESSLWTWSDKTNYNKVIISGSVSGSMNVGGIVGQSSSELNYFINQCNVTASAGNAGGIVGAYNGNSQKGSIGNCENQGSVTATAGNAGGIVSENSGRIVDCTNRGNVLAAAGNVGGISAFNTGEIQECEVAGNVTVSVTGRDLAGGISGENSGDIIKCSIKKVAVHNTSKSTKESLVGGIAGINKGNIRLEGEIIKDSTIQAYADGSSAGGIAGENTENGVISGESPDTPYTEIKNVNLVTASSISSCSLGGVAGKQSGTSGVIKGCRVLDTQIGKLSLLGNTDQGYGGIAGTNAGLIQNCSFDGSVTAGGNGSNIANLGGITGKNLTDGSIERCYIGLDKGEGNTIIQSGVRDTQNENKVYTAYLGGIAGWNFGKIQDCDNQGNGSIDHVTISGNGGIVGGIVGRNEAGAVATGLSDTQKLSTGDNWSVEHYYYINDSGTGGICGWSGSGQSMKYVENYADVANLSGIKDSTAVGGIIGRLENQESNDFTIENSKNAGNISGPSNTGGFVGRWKYNGGTLKSSSNTGNVGSGNSLIAGGMVASLYDLTDDTSIMVTGCTNLGKVTGTDAGGIVGKPDMCNSSNLVVLNDCINAGDISANNGAGIILNADSNTSVTLNRCRNYGSGTKGTFYGIEYSKSNLIKMQDCFDFSGKGLVQKLNDASKIVNSYYYTKEINAGITEEEARQGVEAAEKKVSIAEKAVEEAKEKLNQVNDAGYGENIYYDSSAEENFYDHSVMKHAADGYQGGFESVFEGNLQNNIGYQLSNKGGNKEIKEGNPLNLSFTFAKTMLDANQSEGVKILNYPEIKSFGIYWGSNQNMNPTGVYARAYIYKVSYTTSDGTIKYLKVTDEKPENYITTSFNDNKLIKAYKNLGNIACSVTSVENEDDATQFFTYGLDKSTEAGKADSYARFELPSNEKVKEIHFYVGGIASYKGNISQVIESGTKIGYSTAGTVNKFIASTTRGAADLAYDPADPENHVLNFADAESSPDWRDADLAYENAKKDYQKALEILEEANERLQEIQNGGSIDDDINAPSDDPEKSGSSMYAAKKTVAADDIYYTLKSAGNEGKNVLNMVQIPSRTAKESGRRLGNIVYSDLDQPNASWDHTLVEQYYLDAYNLPLDDETPEFTVSSAGGKVTLKIKEIPGAYGYQMCYQSQDQTDIGNLSSPVYIPNVVTTVQNNTGYIEYVLSPDQNWYQSRMDFYIRAVNGTAYMNYYDSQEKFRDEEGQYKDPAAADRDQDGQFTAKNVSKWAEQSMQLLAPQAAPKVHLELVYLETSKVFGWKPVLENPGDFQEGTEILVYASTDITNKVAAKNNLRFTIQVGVDGTYTSKAEKELPASHLNNINYAAKASALEGAASESALTMYQSAFYGISNLQGNDLYYDTWKGFYGNTPDNLSYQIGETPNANGTNKAVDLYIDSELVVLDYLTLEDGTKVDVAVSSGQSHVTSIGANTVISELSGLPTELLEDYTDYSVRTYPWKNQWSICQYGHVVKGGVSADELTAVTDADRNGESIFKENDQGIKELRPGYSVRLEKDGTYTVVYSIFMQYSSQFGKQFKQNMLHVNEGADGQRTSVSQTENAAKQIPIQQNPVIEEDGCTVQPKGDGAQYTFTWDEDLVQSGAVYDLQLYGMTSGGRTLLASQDRVKTNEYTFEDTNGNWNYKNMALRVIRVGSPEDDASAVSKKLPFYTEKIFDVKIALERISRPKVSLHQKDKDHLYYDVEWTGIAHTEQDQIPDYLAGYAVTAERSQEDTVCSQYDAAGIQALKEDLEAEGYTVSQGEGLDAVTYRRTIEHADSEIYREADRVEKTVEITKNSDGTYTAARKEIWTFFNLNEVETASSAKIVRAVDLSEFTGNTKLKISVRALASQDSSVYKDGPSGVGSEMTLPKRLDTPDMEKLLEGTAGAAGDKLEMQETYHLQECMTLDQMNVLEDTNGLHINIWDHSRLSSGKYELNMAFYEEYPFDTAQGENQAGETAGTARPKYRLKDANVLMEGSLKKGSYHLPGTGIKVVDGNGETQTLRLSDLAGMYCVLAFRATADNEISSLWTYEDRHKVSYVQFRIPRAQSETPKLSESQTEVIYSGGGHLEEDIQGVGGTVVKQTTLTGSVEDYAQDFLFETAHHSQKVDGMSDYDTRIDLDWIYAKRSENGYSIYLLSTDKDEMESLGTESPDTEAAERMDVQNAGYVGELPMGGSLDLPYRLEIQTGSGSMTTTSYLKCQADGQGNTQLVLVLADAEAVNGTAVSEYARTKYVKAVGLTGSIERYEDSKTASWYREEENVPADDSLSYGTGALSAREGYSLEVPLAGDSKSHYIYRITDLAEYGSTYAKTKGGIIESVLFLKEYGNGTLLPEFRRVEDKRIAGGWKSAGDAISLYDETTYTDANVKQPQVYMNTRDDRDQYVIVIAGYSQGAQIYLERVTKADGEIYYHVFYNDTRTDLASAYPLAGTKKEKKYQHVSDLMVEKEGTYYPSCSEEQNAYYLGDIREDTVFGLPYLLKTANEAGTEFLETQSKLKWSGNTFAMTLPDVIGIENNTKNFALNQDTQQITFQAAGENYQTNWWYQDGRNVVNQSDIQQNDCLVSLEDGLLDIVYENKLYGYQAVFNAVLDADRKTCTVTETQGSTAYGILFQFTGVDGSVQFRYAPAGNAEFEVQDLDQVTDLKVRVIDWAGGGCTRWQELSGIQIKTAEERSMAEESQKEDGASAEEGHRKDNGVQDTETPGNAQNEDASKNDAQENAPQKEPSQENHTQTGNVQDNSTQNGTSGEEPKHSDGQ